MTNNLLPILMAAVPLFATAAQQEPSGTPSRLYVAESDPDLGIATDARSFFHVGFHTLNPYRIDNDTHEINQGGAEASLFLEFVVNRRWAWDRVASTSTGRTGQVITDLNAWDFQGRFSYTFKQADEATAATIVGAGDFAAEISLAKHLWRAQFDENQSAHSLNLEVSYGAITDRKILDVHSRLFLGLSYVVGMNEPLTIVHRESKPSDNDSRQISRRVLYVARIGAVSLEEPEFENTTNRVVRFSRGLPEFSPRVGYGFESELYFPVFKQSFITAGGRIYGNFTPNQWAVYLGYTMPIAPLFQAIFK